jgi:hypothetical protein
MTTCAKPSRSRLRFFLRLAVLLAVILGIPLGLIASCQSKLIYFPRPYGPGTTAEWQRNTAGKPINFTTSQGKQRAFLQGDLTNPRNLWIVCGGNGTVALDWSEWIAEHAPSEDAYLLVDFPGYGDCEGAPSPGHIRESIKPGFRSRWAKSIGREKSIPAACDSSATAWAARPV